MKKRYVDLPLAPVDAGGDRQRDGRGGRGTRAKHGTGLGEGSWSSVGMWPEIETTLFRPSCATIHTFGFLTSRPLARRTRGGGIEITSVIWCALIAKVIWT